MDVDRLEELNDLVVTEPVSLVHWRVSPPEMVSNASDFFIDLDRFTAATALRK